MSLAERAIDVGWDEDGPALQLVRADPLTSPVIYASPHSGRLYPASMMARSRLDAMAVRASEDAYVDRLIAPAAEAGAALMLARFARAYVDVNRELGELDPEMFDGVRTRNARSARVAAGLGAVPRVVAHGAEIYRDKLPAGEGERRLAQVWRPWHAALDAMMAEARGRFGRAVLIDWHSMPPPPLGARTGNGRAPDIVLGDRFGRSCAPHLTTLVQGELESLGYTVARNAPYAGGWTTQRYGRPGAGLHTLQIEIRRSLYLDPTALHPGPGFEALKRDVERLTRRLVRVVTEMR